MPFQNRIVTEEPYQLKAAARAAMRGRMGTAFGAGLLYFLCMGIPAVVIEHIAGTWRQWQEAMSAFYDMAYSLPVSAMLATPETVAKMNEWVETYSGAFSTSNATFLFTLLVSGPLSLGAVSAWLRLLRGQPAGADMVIAGFENFPRAFLLHVVKSVFQILWTFLLVIPGIIAYYRYSMAYYLLSDNPKMGALQAISLSKALMQGNKMKRFLLDLSFLGWAVLALVVVWIVSSVVMGTVGVEDPDSMFYVMLGMQISWSIAFAAIYSYRGVAVAEFYRIVSGPALPRLRPPE